MDPVRATRRRAFVVVMGLATSAMMLVRGIIAQGDIVWGEGLVLLLSLLVLSIVAASVRAFMLGVSLGPKGVILVGGTRRPADSSNERERARCWGRRCLRT